MKKPLKWYKKGKTVRVNDKMQKTKYRLAENPGENFHKDFNPDLTPAQMLALGVFEGKYMNDGEGEFPSEWYAKAKLSKKADPSINLFKIKSRLSLQEWRKRGWIPVADNDIDIRGWFQWYCRYYIGRRMPEIDKIQIKRWRSFVRHKGQVVKSLTKMAKKDRPVGKKQLAKHRPRQRQALLQWAYDPWVK